jgi:N-acetylglucosaminyldiphosphoundecaprenol N-acetyl-beta-D-mannosaminyltransferase
MPQNDGATFWLLGLPVDCVTMAQAKARIISAARTRTRLFFATPNVNFLALANRNPSFREAVLRTDLSLVDGMPLVWIARLLGIPVPERVAGSNLIEELLAEKLTPPLRVFFFGGAPGVSAAACARVNELQGGLLAVGWHDPGFVDLDAMSHDDVLQKINATEADLLIVALGAEKGHLWIERNRDALTIPVVSHLGAVVNFLAGTVKRAPMRLQRLGLEWAWRIVQEPSLALRYARDFLFLVRKLPFVFASTVFRNRQPQTEQGALAIDTDITDADVRTLAPRGHLSAENLHLLQAAILATAPGTRGFALDLKGLKSMDTRAIGFLYELTHRTPWTIHIPPPAGGSGLRAQLARHRADFLCPTQL